MVGMTCHLHFLFTLYKIIGLNCSMNPEENYLSINKAAWNNKVATHIQSDFYNQEAFLKGKNSLQSIELNLLGDLTGKKVLHLQCHFGQDTISLSRLGAIATGVDFSEEAIHHARSLTQECKTNTEFVCCNIYDLPQHLDDQFDIVFTSYGTIGWLPDLNKWAAVIAQFLKPNGKFVFVEFHPVVWMFDDDFTKAAYSYFNKGAIYETEVGTYAERNASISQSFVNWNHDLGTVISSLLRNGMELLSFEEFDYSPYNCFYDTVAIAPDKFIIQHIGDKIPMVYALSTRKKE